MGKFPWIDFLSLVLFIRIIYIAFQRGLIYEIVKLLGIFLVSFFSLQYYSLFLGEFFGKEPFSFDRSILDPLSFFIIFFFTLFIFFLISRIISIISLKERHALGERIIACILGILRASTIVSIFLFCAFVFFSHRNIDKSISFRVFKKVAPLIYIKTYGMYKKINPSIKVNKEVLNYYEAVKNLPGSNKKRY
mgnify:CR=1 FL=1